MSTPLSMTKSWCLHLLPLRPSGQSQVGICDLEAEIQRESGALCTAAKREESSQTRLVDVDGVDVARRPEHLELFGDLARAGAVDAEETLAVDAVGPLARCLRTAWRSKIHWIPRSGGRTRSAQQKTAVSVGGRDALFLTCLRRFSGPPAACSAS